MIDPSLHLQAVELLVELASLQTSFLTLDEAIKTTNRRVNALENVVKPKLENTISYIKGELDELEREEFFRLKKVQANKKKVADRDLKVRVLSPSFRTTLAFFWRSSDEKNCVNASYTACWSQFHQKLDRV